jgi:hypothetical protein
VPVELRNCEPPKLVQASTKTTIASGQEPEANSASKASITVGWNALRVNHMSSWPV